MQSKINFPIKIVFTLIITLSSFKNSFSQSELSSDSLFVLAREEAYQKNNYPGAINLMKIALNKSPNYTDLRIFLGRLYTFSDKLDSARNEFQYILNTDPKNEDAINGIYDLEYWNENYKQAQKIAELGINYYPDSASYYVKKARTVNALELPYEAIDFLEKNSAKIARDSAALFYLKDLKNNNLKNRIGINYEYVDFDKRFNEPWHFGTITYGHRTGIGRVNARLYYANRFDSQGLQGEVEAYPSLKGIGYQYIGFAVSDSPIFPRFRAGYSLFASLPKSFEGEVGFRYLRFSDNTFLFTGAIGRYSGNNFYNIRTFISPGETAWSYSFTASARFFMSDDLDDFFSVSAGTGVSPDDRIRLLFINSFANLKSYKAALSYNKVIRKKHLFSIDAGWVNEEYNTDAWGNQYTLGFGYSRRF